MSIISCFTGWLPEPLPLRFGHISEVWRFLKDTLPKYQWQEDKPKTVLEDELLDLICLNESCIIDGRLLNCIVCIEEEH